MPNPVTCLRDVERDGKSFAVILDGFAGQVSGIPYKITHLSGTMSKWRALSQYGSQGQIECFTFLQDSAAACRLHHHPSSSALGVVPSAISAIEGYVVKWNKVPPSSDTSPHQRTSLRRQKRNKLATKDKMQKKMPHFIPVC